MPLQVIGHLPWRGNFVSLFSAHNEVEREWMESRIRAISVAHEFNRQTQLAKKLVECQLLKLHSNRRDLLGKHVAAVRVRVVEWVVVVVAGLHAARSHVTKLVGILVDEGRGGVVGCVWEQWWLVAAVHHHGAVVGTVAPTVAVAVDGWYQAVVVGAVGAGNFKARLERTVSKECFTMFEKTKKWLDSVKYSNEM